MAKSLGAQCARVVEAVRNFELEHSAQLPKLARERIVEFLGTTGQLIASDNKDAPKVRMYLVTLAAFEAEISFLLSDIQQTIRSRVEIAFAHLQRLLAVDDDLRAKWKGAFSVGETRCEQFGGVHLLWHGIWAFKINAEGARTDLVFPETEGLFSPASALGSVPT